MIKVNLYPETKQMMEAVVERENMETALYPVRANKGIPGVDIMTVDDLRGYIMVGIVSKKNCWRGALRAAACAQG